MNPVQLPQLKNGEQGSSLPGSSSGVECVSKQMDASRIDSSEQHGILESISASKEVNRANIFMIAKISLYL
jgi:hypothetical protein